MVGYLLNILMEQDFNIRIIFGIKEKTINLTMYFWLSLTVRLKTGFVI